MLNEFQSWILLFIIIGICLVTIVLYFWWFFIKSAVKAGVKEAIKETLIDTGNLSFERMESGNKDVIQVENFRFDHVINDTDSKQ